LSEQEAITLRPLRQRKRRRILQSATTEAPSDEEYITGPLGIWPWPILNVILRFIHALRRKTYVTPTVEKRKRRTVIHEVVRDEKGRIVEIVEREMEDSV